jgi:hypothetical protein
VNAITWVADTQGDIADVAALPAAAQASAMAAVERLLSDVRALADRLATENRELARLARVLRAVARTPPAALVRMVGTQPVIILWTHEATAATLVAPSASASGPAVAMAAPAVGRGLGWLHVAWVLPLVLGALLAVVAIGDGTTQISEDPRIAALRARLDQLRTVDPAHCTPAAKPN